MCVCNSVAPVLVLGCEVVAEGQCADDYLITGHPNDEEGAQTSRLCISTARKVPRAVQPVWFLAVMRHRGEGWRPGGGKESDWIWCDEVMKG